MKLASLTTTQPFRVLRNSLFRLLVCLRNVGKAYEASALGAQDKRNAQCTAKLEHDFVSSSLIAKKHEKNNIIGTPTKKTTLHNLLTNFYHYHLTLNSFFRILTLFILHP